MLRTLIEGGVNVELCVVLMLLPIGAQIGLERLTGATPTVVFNSLAYVLFLIIAADLLIGATRSACVWVGELVAKYV